MVLTGISKEMLKFVDENCGNEDLFALKRSRGDCIYQMDLLRQTKKNLGKLGKPSNDLDLQNRKAITEVIDELETGYQLLLDSYERSLNLEFRWFW